jgi:hypothetical protein
VQNPAERGQQPSPHQLGVVDGHPRSGWPWRQFWRSTSNP